MEHLYPLFQAAKERIAKAQKIVLLAHRKPDGDTLGATLALHFGLRAMGKETTLACWDTPADVYHFLPDIERFVTDFSPSLFDLGIVSDAGASYMTKFHERYPDLFTVLPFINIDHHPSNDNYGAVNIVHPTAASTTMITFAFLKYCGMPVTRQMATALLTGLYTDTGSLRHSNTTPEVYRTAAALLKLGGNLPLIINTIFKTKPLGTLRLWGRVLSNIRTNEDGVTLSVATNQDIKDCDSDEEALSGVIDYLNAVPDAKFSVLLSEDSMGHVKGSFRTMRDDVDLSAIAGVFGGGGHKKAAGFTIPGRLAQEVRWHIVGNQTA